jgi:high-affinity iron transporter
MKKFGSKMLHTSWLWIALLCCFITVKLAWTETKPDYTVSVRAIEQNIHEALQLHAAGKYDEASELVSDTYFDIFEGVESAIALRSSTLKTQLENEFNALRTEIATAQDEEKITAQGENLAKRIQAAVYQLKEDDSWWDKFLSSFFIILREGFEAILIVGAMTAFLIKTKNHDQLYLVKNSSLVAVGLSVVLAAVFQFILHVTAAQKELVEGLTMCLACGVLFVVGHWLISQAENQHWLKYVKHQLSDAISSKSKKAIWLTCFLAVFREGAETVLFYQALWASSGPVTKSSVISGFLLGAAALFLLFVVYKKSALKIPMKPFFRVTSALLYYLSISMSGKAIVELQAGGYMSVHRIESLPALPWLGFYPTFESLVFQGILIVALVGSITWVYVKSYRQRRLFEQSNEMGPSLEEAVQ